MANTITNYEWFALNNLNKKCMKNFVSAIVLSAIEDGDVEFFEDDYDSWKNLRKKRLRKYEVMTENDYEDEFEYKQYCKELMFQILQIRITSNDIPKNIIEMKELFENNTIDDLIAMTELKKAQILSIAKKHNWKIGSEINKPTIFDL